MRCPPLYGKNIKQKKKKRVKKRRRVVTLEEEKIVRLEKRRENWNRPQENQKDSAAKILKVKESIWKSRVRKDVYKKGLGSYYRSQRDI